MTGSNLSANAFVVAFLASTMSLAAPPPNEKPDGEAVVSPMIDAVLAAHNRERSQVNLPALSISPKLEAAARAHAYDMAAHSKMTHEGSDGSSGSDRVKRQGYQYLTTGENVAQGYETVEAVMRGWMESPHHKENILGKYTEIGIAIARSDDDKPYWCVDFGTPWPKLDPATTADELIAAINKERSAAKLKLLKKSSKLMSAAARIAGQYAKADKLDLKVRDDLATVLKGLEYRYRQYSESAASGQPAVADVLATWNENASIREQILGNFRDIGVAYADSASGRPYWMLIIARPPPE